MGNCLSSSSPQTIISKEIKILPPPPFQTAFTLPSPLPTFPPGGGFASGSIDLGGLQVCQISSFIKVWATHEGGPDNHGAAFFEPSPIPEGYFMLGCYGQPNNKPFSGWVLAGKDNPSGGTLKRPVDYTLVWSSESLTIKQDGYGYIWLPTPPDGYKAVGHVITSTPDKPSLEKIRCVRSDLTDQCETDTWIWGKDKEISENGLSFFGLKPINIGITSLGVPVGTFTVQIGGDASTNNSSLACLKNTSSKLYASMPNLNQIEALLQVYSPLIYLHPDEEYLPSSVEWFFNNGALLYKKGEESQPVSIESTGKNLPQGGSNDDSYWLDLPVDEEGKEFIRKGDLQTSKAYLHIKPMLGATFTDIAMWVFYPYNGPATAKIGLINVPLGRIGEHVGDWEHLTLRISNFNGELRHVYFSQHSGGTWVDASEVEFANGNNVVAYASLHGHALYQKAGLVLQGNELIGIRNDTAKSKKVMDIGVRFSIVGAEYLGRAIVEPPWLNYFRKWGPTIIYELEVEIKNVENVLPEELKSVIDGLVKSLPSEVFGEEGPTGPKVKSSWNGDEA